MNRRSKLAELRLRYELDAAKRAAENEARHRRRLEMDLVECERKLAEAKDTASYAIGIEVERRFDNPNVVGVMLTIDANAARYAARYAVGMALDSSLFVDRFAEESKRTIRNLVSKALEGK